MLVFKQTDRITMSLHHNEAKHLQSLLSRLKSKINCSYPYEEQKILTNLIRGLESKLSSSVDEKPYVLDKKDSCL